MLPTSSAFMSYSLLVFCMLPNILVMYCVSLLHDIPYVFLFT